MMAYIADNFEYFANTYVRILIFLLLLFMAILLAKWLRPFTTKKASAIITALVYFALMAVKTFMSIDGIAGHILEFANILLPVIVLWMLDRKRNPVQKIFLWVVFKLMSWLSIEIFTEIGLFEGELVLDLEWYSSGVNAVIIEFVLWNTLQYVLTILLLYIAIKVLHRVYREKTDELSLRELVMLLTPAWSLLAVKPIMSSYLSLWLEGMKNGTIDRNVPGNPFRLIFCILSFFTIVILVTFYEQSKEKQDDEFARLSLAKQIKDIEGHYAHIEDIYEKMRALRHDMGNLLAVAGRLAETGKPEELRNFISDMKDTFEELTPQIKSGNAVTDAILSEYALRSGKEGISFTSSFFYPDGLSLNPFDMSVILTNALQNALEASKGFDAAAIQIKSVARDRVFMINIRNTVRNECTLGSDGLPSTTKHDAGHGYGLKNIRAIAARYNGDIEIRYENDGDRVFFVLNIMLIG